MVIPLTGRMAELSAKLAVPGEHLLGAGHPTSAAGRGQDVHAGGQVIQGHHEEGEQGPPGYPGRHTARYVQPLSATWVYCWNVILSSRDMAEIVLQAALNHAHSLIFQVCLWVCYQTI